MRRLIHFGANGLAGGIEESGERGYRGGVRVSRNHEAFVHQRTLSAALPRLEQPGYIEVWREPEARAVAAVIMRFSPRFSLQKFEERPYKLPDPKLRKRHFADRRR